MSRFSIKGTTWDIMPGSVDVSDCITSQEVMQKAKLDYTVDKCQLVAKMQINTNDMDATLDEVNAGEAFIHGKEIFRECPNSFATYRTDKNIPLGDVKSKYEIVQNKSAFKFFDDAIGKDKAIFKRAGAFGVGGRIFVAAKLPKNILVKGDECENYLVFTNSHDGSSSVQILFTPIRIICQNTLNAAIRSSENFVRFRHTNAVHGNILTGADILGITEKKRQVSELLYNQLADIKVSDDEVMTYIANTYLSPIELENIVATNVKLLSIFNKNYLAVQDSKLSTRKVNQLSDTFEYYLNGPGQDRIRGNAWGAYNAITGYYSNVDNAVGEKRMDSLLFGSKANTMTKALELAIN